MDSKDLDAVLSTYNSKKMEPAFRSVATAEA